MWVTIFLSLFGLIQSQTFRTTNYTGGTGGIAFSDLSIGDGYRLYSIGITVAPYETNPGLVFLGFQTCYSQIDSLTVKFVGIPTCNNALGACPLCPRTTFIFNNKEYITAASGCSNSGGSFVGRLAITTNFGRQQIWGNGTTACVKRGEDLIGFSGRSGGVVDQLSLRMRNSTCYNNGVRTSPTSCSCVGGFVGYQCNLQITSGLITTSKVTSGDITTALVTSNSMTSGDITTSPITSEVMTTSLVTSSDLTSSPVTTLSGIKDENSSKSSQTPIIAIAVSVCAFIIVSVAILILLIRRKKNSKKGNSPDSEISFRHSISLNHQSLGGFLVKYSDLKFGSQIGSGAFGVVYKGTYRQTEVAIKQLLNNVESTEEILEEAALMQKILPHPNVVLFRGVTLPPDPVCILTDFCSGGSLLNYLKNNRGTITTSQIISFARDIAVGMLHLHVSVPGVEIVHRDLAARNVLIKRDGSAAISDFGLARVKSNVNEQAKTNNPVGPLKWMAPESAQSMTYSTKSDSFSYGVVLYEIITQDEPWPGMNGGNRMKNVNLSVQAITKVVNGERMEIPLTCPDILQGIMKQCWSQDPEKRLDFQEIASLLNANRGNEVVQDTPKKSSNYSHMPPDENYQNLTETNDYKLIVQD